jgi:hypothetical protein
VRACSSNSLHPAASNASGDPAGARAPADPLAQSLSRTAKGAVRAAHPWPSLSRPASGTASRTTSTRNARALRQQPGGNRLDQRFGPRRRQHGSRACPESGWRSAALHHRPRAQLAGKLDRRPPRSRRPRPGPRDPRRSQPRTATQPSGHPRRAAESASRKAAGPSHPSGCPGASAPAPRPGPGSHSRPPCRATPRWRHRPPARPAQPLERHHAGRQPVPRHPVRPDEGHRRKHPVPPPRQQGQAGARLLLRLRLGQDPPPRRDHRIGRQHQRPRLPRRRRFLRRHTPCISAGSSLLRGVSSISVAITASGVTPRRASSSSRRGEAEAAPAARAPHLKR